MDIVCFSHLRWNFVYQRPQHILSRFAKHFRLFYIEEPLYHSREDICDISLNDNDVYVVVPMLDESSKLDLAERQKKILSAFFRSYEIEEYLFWYYNPMALLISDHFHPVHIIYDCMDELSAFKFAPSNISLIEATLFKKAGLVFTGGLSLYQAKCNMHHNIYAFPSSIDKHHFSRARQLLTEPADQAGIPHPRLGFYGVLDERLDINLLAELALKRPAWQVILIGPVVKINPQELPRLPNLHYLGAKSYNELPVYLSGWDIALIPFAINESTRFISPTKTPEYLAAGKPVISTPIKDVVDPYGQNELVHIAATTEDFVAAAEKELITEDRSGWLKKVDSFLFMNSWDETWRGMNKLLNKLLLSKTMNLTTKKGNYV